MKILSIFRFFRYILFIDSENLCFILISKETMTRFDIVHFPDFEIANYPSNRLRTSQFKNLISAEGAF